MAEGEEKQILNTLAKGAGITAAGMFISKFFTYLYRALVGRALGPEAYGMLTTGIMIGGIAATFSGAPLKNGLKKFMPEFREDDDWASIKGSVISSLQITFIGSIITGSIIFTSSEFIAVQIFENKNLIPVIQVFGFLQLISRPSELIIETTVAFNKAKYKVIAINIFQPLLQLSITAGLIFFAGMGVMGAVWGWVSAVALTIPLGVYFLEKKIGPVLTRKIKSVHHRKKLLKFSYPLMFSGMVSVFLGWTDTAFLGYFMDQSAVGLYNAAYPTALLLLIPLQSLGTLTLTSFSELNAKGKSQSEALKTTARWIFALTFPSFLIMTLFAPELLILLFGEQYAIAGLTLSILALGNLVNASIGHLSDAIQSLGHTKIIFYNTMINLVANVALNIILIPKLGIVGAAIATASSTIIMSIILAAEVYSYEKIHAFSRNMLKTVFAGITSLGIVYITFKQIFTATPIWALIPAGLIFFTTHTLIFLKIGGLKEYDEEIILTAGEKIGYKEEVRKLLEKLT